MRFSTCVHRARRPARGPRISIWLRGTAVATLLFPSVLAGAPGASVTASPRTVLMVYGENRLHPAVTIVDEAFRSAVQENTPSPVEFLTEFLDTDRFTQDGYDSMLTTFLAGKYKSKPVDVVVTAGPTALKFLLHHRQEFLPHAPLVHMVVSRAQLQALAPPGDVVGVPVDTAPLPTLELALRLRPQTRRLVFVTGTSDWDRQWERQLQNAVPQLPPGVQTEFLAGLSMEATLQRLRRLSDDAAVFVPTFFRDGAGRSFVSGEAAAQFAAASPVPVYGPYSTYIGKGIVGGYMPTFEEIGRQAGAIVQGILRGEPPEQMRLPTVQSNHYLLDWRQLQRFRIDDKRLPEGSITKFREPSYWEAYRERAIAIIAVIALQAALIAVLLLERRSRQRTSAELRDSERRMNLAAAATGVGLWVWDTVHDQIHATQKARELHGVGSDEPVDFARFLMSLHPADQSPTRQTIEDALASQSDYEIQYRILSPQGETRWITTRGQVAPHSVMGVSFDITARKAAEMEAEQSREELVRVTRAGMLGQLSGAIAHELGQPLTAILSNAQAAQRMLEFGPTNHREIQDIFSDIVAENQRAVEVIRRLRALFKQGSLQRQTLNLNELARDVLKLVHSDLLTRHVSVAVDLASDLPLVSGDRVQLQQVMLNLILNSCEAMTGNPPERCNLTIRTLRDENGACLVEVSDLGHGLDPACVDKLFAPLYTTKPQGMGMGLAICRSIVECHGGELTAFNNEPDGATFRVKLPSHEAE